jgi:hypothetical protein
MYSSELTTNSQTYSGGFPRADYYYEAIQVNVVDTGCYILRRNSTVDTFGYLYKDNFSPPCQSENPLSEDDDSGGGGQFKLTTYLQISTTYVLVVTTSSPNVRGNFSIFVSGSNNVSLNRKSGYMYCLLSNQHRSRKYRKCLSTQFPF